METLKDRFYDAMIDVVEVEKKMNNFLVVLHALEEQYNVVEMKETYAVINVITLQVQMLQEELAKVLEGVNNIECGLEKRIRLGHIR